MPGPNLHGLILAGGRGTRFWPRSRRRNPKQLLPFIGERTLLRDTFERLRPLLPPERIWVLTGEHLRGEILRQLPEVPGRQVLSEPVPRNTAPCLGLAAHILRAVDPGAVLGVFPADHFIGKPQRFRRLLRPAFRAAAQGHIAVLGIQPRWPETGYGYIEFPEDFVPGGARTWPVRRFHEKPNLKTAKRYLAAGHFCWNAGMFFWRADVFMETLRRLQPGMAALLDRLPPFGHRRFATTLREVFPLFDNVSVDYAVLEKAAGVVGVAAGDIGWSDLGSWNAVYELLPHTAEGNVARSGALLVDSRDNYIEAPGKMVALLGVRDLIVVDTPDALLVANRVRAQQVGELVKLLERRKRDDLL